MLSGPVVVPPRTYRRICKRFDAAWQAGKFVSIAEYKDAKHRAMRKAGKPIPPDFIARAIEQHGDRGLAALDVAASWTLPPADKDVPQRKVPEGARPKASRRTAGRSSRDGPRRDSDDDEPLAPLPARVPAERLAPLILRQINKSGETIDDLAARSGVPPRRLRSILHGEQPRVSFAVADRIVTYALDGPTLWLGELADLYEVAV